MGIAKYIKEIGRGKDGARSLARAQAADLMGQVLDGGVTDLEIGGFCLAMRIKGETPEEMAGFLDAVHARLTKVPFDGPAVVIPSYNGARRLPVLTPLLATLLAREGAVRGFSVLMHGCATEDTRITSQSVLKSLFYQTNEPLAQGNTVQAATKLIVHDNLCFVPTEALSPALKRLLDVRRAVGLRNPAHSMVKLMNPTTSAQALLVTSYTHPEYLHSMTATLQLTGSQAMLLRGTEGESVADARRAPQMDGFVHGAHSRLHEATPGSIASLPDLPKAIDAQTTAEYIREILHGEKPVPAPIALQVEHILHLLHQLSQIKPVKDEGPSYATAHAI
jgi:anthranilate phosphoribosyltransferase